MRRAVSLAIAAVLGVMLISPATAPASIFSPAHFYTSSVSSLFHGRSIVASPFISFDMGGAPGIVSCTTAQFDGITPTANRTATAITFTPRYPAPGGAACTYSAPGVTGAPAFVTSGCDWTLYLQSYDNVSGRLQFSAFDTGNGGCTAAMVVSVPTLPIPCTFTIPVQSVSVALSGQDRRSNDTADATGPTATGMRFDTNPSGISLGYTSNCTTGTRTVVLGLAMAIGPQSGHLSDVGLWGGP